MTLIHIDKLTGSTSSGSLVVTTTARLQGILRQLIVSPATDTTTWDIKMTDADSIISLQRTGRTGLLSEELALPLHGTYTITVSGASADEVFTIKLIVQE